MNNLSIKEYDLIHNELNAFRFNMKSGNDIIIYKQKKLYYIFIDTMENVEKCASAYDYYKENYNNYTYFVYNIHELKGWLYGVVQAKNKII